MTFEEWKAKPIRRRVTAFRAANGRHQLHLTESHLNSFYFIENKRASNAVKAKDVVERWLSDWSLQPEDIPDIDKLEIDAHHDEELQRLRNMPLNEAQLAAVQAELPEELNKELDRHTEGYFEHFRKNVLADGDEYKSCRISRGMKKLHAIALWRPVIERALDTIGTIKESGDSFGCFMVDCRKLLGNATVRYAQRWASSRMMRITTKLHESGMMKTFDSPRQC